MGLDAQCNNHTKINLLILVIRSCYDHLLMVNMLYDALLYYYSVSYAVIVTMHYFNISQP